MDPTWLAENAEKAGIIGILAFMVVSMMLGWVVSGKQYDKDLGNCRDENKVLRTQLDDANNRDRSRLDRTESALDAVMNRPKGA